MFHARYGPDGDVFEARKGSLESFLIERYCLYAEHAGRLLRAEIHHAPWPLQPARGEIELNTMAPVELPPGEPVLHYARADRHRDLAARADRLSTAQGS